MLGVKASPSRQELEVLKADLLQSFMNGLVLLSRMPSPFTHHAGDFPKASALARYQAKTSGSVTSLRHEQVNLDDVARVFLSWLDGQTSRDSLKARLQQQFPQMPEQGFTILLDGLAKAGLLLA